MKDTCPLSSPAPSLTDSLSFEQVARLRCVAQAGLELVTFLPKPVRVLGLQISATMSK